MAHLIDIGIPLSLVHTQELDQAEVGRTVESLTAQQEQHFTTNWNIGDTTFEERMKRSCFRIPFFFGIVATIFCNVGNGNSAIVIDDFVDDLHIETPKDEDKFVTTFNVGPLSAVRTSSVFAPNADPVGVLDVNTAHRSQALFAINAVNPTSTRLFPTISGRFNYEFSSPVDLTNAGDFHSFLVDFRVNRGPVPPQRLRLLVRQDVAGNRHFWEQSFSLSHEELLPFTAAFPFTGFISRGGGPFAPPFTSVPEFEMTFLNQGDPNGQWEIRLESIRIGALHDGDYNADGRVDQADLDLVLLNWGAAVAPATLGWYHNLPQGTIDQSELDHLLLHWGGRIELLAAAAGYVAIPEPTAILILIVLSTAVSVVVGLKRRNRFDKPCTECTFDAPTASDSPGQPRRNRELRFMDH